MQDSIKKLEFTGERYMPEITGNIELEHLHRYFLASQIVRGKTVLDIASGEGYGSALLSETAQKVYGVDIAIDAIDHAKARYTQENLEFLQGSCAKIPLPDDSVDIVVSFETIEHHDQHEEMMREIKRVLKSDGILVISSPDKENYTDKTGVINPHHVKELYADEFKDLINVHFKHAAFYGQRVGFGSYLVQESGKANFETLYKSDELTTTKGIREPLYWIAIASDKKLPQVNLGLYEKGVHESEQYLALQNQFQAHLHELKQLRQAQPEKDARIAELEQYSNAVAGENAQIKGQLQETVQQLTHTQGELEHLRQHAHGLQEQVNHVNQVLVDTRAVAEQRQAELSTAHEQNKIISAENAGLKAQQEKLEKTLSQTQEKLGVVTAELGFTQKAQDKLEQKYAALETKLYDTQQQVSAKQTQLTIAENDKSKAEKAVDALTQKHEALQSQASAVMSSLTLTEEARRQAEQQLLIVSQKLADRESKYEAVLIEKQRFETELMMKREALEALQKQFEKLEVEAEKKSTQLGSWEEKYGFEKKQKEAAEKELVQFTKNLLESDKTAATLRQHNTDLREENTQLLAKINELNKALDYTREQYECILGKVDQSFKHPNSLKKIAILG